MSILVFQPRIYTSAAGRSMPYRLRVPDDDTPGKSYPLVLFLHGAGERGTDNEAQLKWCGSVLGEQLQKRHPCFIVAPQCPPGRQWVNTPWTAGSYSVDAIPESEELRIAIGILKGVGREFNGIDPGRVFVAGLSMGGYGTRDAIMRHPDLFAAAVPICGAGDPSQASSMGHVKVWAFHGSEDDVVPPEGSREMVQALRNAGADVRYTEFEGVGHRSWINTWEEKDLFEWLFQQRRRG